MIKLKNLLLNEAVTIHKINREAKKYGIKLVAGKGYYYWIALTDEVADRMKDLFTTSINVSRPIKHGSWDFWMSELKDIIKRAKLRK